MMCCQEAWCRVSKCLSTSEITTDQSISFHLGISSYADTPSAVSSYLKPLLTFAADHIPVEKHKETPLYIMATAGMRMLPERWVPFRQQRIKNMTEFRVVLWYLIPTYLFCSQQEAIMNNLRSDIPLEYEFLFTENHAEVISGKQEGVYAWIAINYMLGKFDHMVGGKLQKSITREHFPLLSHVWTLCSSVSSGSLGMTENCCGYLCFPKTVAKMGGRLTISNLFCQLHFLGRARL